mmetsp:Transcript_61836/g.135249  ORF Transcript_61836/g.135249 Transcript_61836/m.135249 type:complete len:87 (-) Transcript_61836:95-355(-)
MVGSSNFTYEARSPWCSAVGGESGACLLSLARLSGGCSLSMLPCEPPAKNIVSGLGESLLTDPSRPQLQVPLPIESKKKEGMLNPT